MNDPKQKSRQQNPRSERIFTSIFLVLGVVSGFIAAFYGASSMSLDKKELLTTLIPVLAATTAVLMTAGAALISQGRNHRPSELSGVIPTEVERMRSEITNVRTGDPIPFEIEQLANYYSLSLGQARISFWFSLIFAAIGFLVIVGGAALYSEGEAIAAFIKITSGIIIDAVSALFFVQSRRAQESMSAFFEKLRNDRQFAEARKICDELSDVETRDHLKTILVLHYSGLAAGSVIDALPSRMKRDNRVSSL